VKSIVRASFEGHTLVGDVRTREKWPRLLDPHGAGDGTVTVEGDGERKAAAIRRRGVSLSAHGWE